MFSIKEASYGLDLSFGELVPAEEMARWVVEVTAALYKQKRPFGVLVDLRTLKPLNDEAAEYLQRGEQRFLRAGLERAAVVFDTALVKMQFKRLAKAAGLIEPVRFFDAAKPGWEERAQAWVVSGKEPEQQAAGTG